MLRKFPLLSAVSPRTYKRDESKQRNDAILSKLRADSLTMPDPQVPSNAIQCLGSPGCFTKPSSRGSPSASSTTEPKHQLKLMKFLRSFVYFLCPSSRVPFWFSSALFRFGSTFLFCFCPPRFYSYHFSCGFCGPCIQ